MPQFAPMAATTQPPVERSLPARQEGDAVIEGLRGFAALLVVATHYAPMLLPELGIWGFASTGVDLFFVLSGYVFAPYLFGKPLPLLPHLVRRFFRLYPLYLLALLTYVGLRWPAASAWDHFAVHLFMAHTFSSLEVAYFYNPAFWSLPPEVEYYLLLPLLAWTASRFGSLRYRFVGLVLLAAAMHLLLVATAAPNEGITARAVATIHLPGLWVEFMLGSLAYVLLQHAATPPARWVRLALGLAVLACMALVFMAYVAPITGVTSVVPPWVSGNIGLGAALGYALLVSALASAPRHASAQTSRWFTPWFVFMGELSYGVYLLHNAAAQMLRRLLPGLESLQLVALSLGLTLVLAWVAHHAIERPLRNYGRSLSQAFKK